MTEPGVAGTPATGRLADNVVHFVRVLRTAGLPVGTDRALLALRALGHAGLQSREEFAAVLRCCLVDRHEHLALFDQAFAAFWRDPDLLGRLLSLRLPPIGARFAPPPPKANQRLAAALASPAETTARDRPLPKDLPPLEIGAAFSWSAAERLRKADFDTMTATEWQEARRLVNRLEPVLPRERSRRLGRATRGRIDLRAAMRTMVRQGGDVFVPPRRAALERPAPLVLLIDISGSMSRYSRMLLHFAQSLVEQAACRGRIVSVFVFGTRLTNVSRRLRSRDPDEAIAAVVKGVDDWAGGTRIAEALGEFNRRWARRCGGSRATVLLATDGLDHEDFERLGAEARRLARSSRRLLWLNPLLRYAGFEARARGVKAILPYVDALLPMHNIASLQSLGHVLGVGARREESGWK